MVKTFENNMSTEDIMQMNVYPAFTPKEYRDNGLAEPVFAPEKGEDTRPTILKFFHPIVFCIVLFFGMFSMRDAMASGQNIIAMTLVAGVSGFVMQSGVKEKNKLFMLIGLIMLAVSFTSISTFSKVFSIVMIASFAGLYNNKLFYTKPRLSSDVKCLSVEDLKTSIWGVAGEGIGSSDVGTEGRRKAGAAGEEYFGKFLNTLTEKYPHVKVFHGLKFNPYGGTRADVDHCVVIGEKVFLLDSKNWKYGDYEWETGKEYDYRLKRFTKKVIRNGGDFQGGTVHLEVAEQNWRNWLYASKCKKFYNKNIRTFIVMTKNDGKGEYNIDNTNAPYKSTTLNTIPQIMEILEEEAQKTDLVNRSLLYYVVSGLK